MKNIIIVEDDPLIAYDLKSILSSNGYSVEAVFHSAEDAIQFDFNSVNIDVALLDVNLGDGMDGTSLGLMLHEKYNLPSIFITSYYDEKTVLKAKLASPLAYIIKPYEEQDILTNLSLAVSRKPETAIVTNSEPIFVKSGSRLTKIIPEEILYVQAYDMYAHLFLEGKRITASQTLKEIEKLFKSFNFIRVHRSYLVNLNAIDGICEDEILINKQRIPVGRTHKKGLFDRIKTI